MQRYKNLSGDSGVIAYEIGDDFIKVEFADGNSYLYTDASAGADNVETMKKLACEGKGLSAFISRQVRHRYAAKTGA